MWCGSRFGSPCVSKSSSSSSSSSHRHPHRHPPPPPFLLIIIIIIIIIISCSFLGSTGTGSGPDRSAILVTVLFSIPSWQSPGWKVSTVARIGCVWDEILVTVDGFRAAMWEKCAQSRGFGIFGLGMLGVGGRYHGGGGWRTEDRDHIYVCVYLHTVHCGGVTPLNKAFLWTLKICDDPNPTCASGVSAKRTIAQIVCYVYCTLEQGGVGFA